MPAQPRAHRQRWWRARCAVAGLAGLLAVAGCGGSSKHSSTSTSKTTSSTSTKVPKPKPAPVVTESVIGAKHRVAFGPTLKTTPGDIVEFRTLLPASSASKPTKLNVDISQGPSTTLTVTANAHGHKSTATVTSANGKPLTLTSLHYACVLPPSPTLCPVKHVSVSPKAIHVTFMATTPEPLVLQANVGPIPGVTTKPPPQSSSIVPAYKVAQELRTIPPHVTPAGKLITHPRPATPFALTTSARPGDVVFDDTRLFGLPGAPQPVTIDLDQGPGTSVKITASVPGGTPAVGVITSATGKPITLVVPRYTCFVPPTVTFCPALKTVAGRHHYTLTFNASPLTAPAGIVLGVLVQAG